MFGDKAERERERERAENVAFMPQGKTMDDYMLRVHTWNYFHAIGQEI